MRVASRSSRLPGEAESAALTRVAFPLAASDPEYLESLSRIAAQCLGAHAGGTRELDEQLIESLAKLLQAGAGANVGMLPAEEPTLTSAFLVGATLRMVRRSMIPGCALPPLQTSTIVDLWRRIVASQGTTA